MADITHEDLIEGLKSRVKDTGMSPVDLAYGDARKGLTSVVGDLLSLALDAGEVTQDEAKRIQAEANGKRKRFDGELARERLRR